MALSDLWHKFHRTQDFVLNNDNFGLYFVKHLVSCTKAWTRLRLRTPGTCSHYSLYNQVDKVTNTCSMINIMFRILCFDVTTRIVREKKTGAQPRVLSNIKQGSCRKGNTRMETIERLRWDGNVAKRLRQVTLDWGFIFMYYSDVMKHDGWMIIGADKICWY